MYSEVFTGLIKMMNHKECLAYLKANGNELKFEPGNDYGCLTLIYNNNEGEYYWAVENYSGYCWNSITNYLGDALVNYDASEV